MNWNNSTFADRFKWARAQAKKTQQDVADYIEVSRNAISYWESGKNEAEGRNLELSAKCLNVDVVWLDTGVGNPGVYSPRVKDDYDNDLANTLMRYFAQADQRGRAAIVATAKHEASWNNPFDSMPCNQDKPVKGAKVIESRKKRKKPARNN
jgi:transcriptional regulator with XRE-family HTH domain